ncbi:MAG: hypothetical protein PF689_00590 [Deltaproteobacteria bacterium]|jgi:hypothetical protein|nr:hypothetical protein [Deltaproteobacteria bacterium]
MKNILVFPIICLFITGSAQAEPKKTFEQLAASAQKVQDLENVAGPFLQKCGSGNSLPELQCRAIRAYMQIKVATKTYLYSVDNSALKFGKYTSTFEYPISVLGCITCNKKIEFDPLLFKNNKFHLSTIKPKKIENNELKGIEMGKFKIPVDPRKLNTWNKNVRPFLKVQFLFRVRQEDVWDSKLGQGMTFYQGGYRVYNHCTGEILYSEPSSEGKGPVNKKGCDHFNKKEKKEKKVELPSRPSNSKIQSVMKSIHPQIKKCYEKFQIPGKAKVYLLVSGKTGKVKKLKIKGIFKDTPTGKCILDQVKSLDFGKFKNKKLKFSYPYLLP